MKRGLFIFASLLLALAFACDRITEDPVGDEMARLEAWLSLNSIGTQPTASGLYYISQQPGTGPNPVEGNYIVYSYTARNLDGVVFATSNRETAKLYDLFNLQTHYVPQFIAFNTQQISIIKGLAEGFKLMREGEKARLIIPSKLAYGGSTQYTGVAPFSTVIYDIELHKIVADPEKYERDLLVDYLATNHPGLAPTKDSIYYIGLSAATCDTCTVAVDSVVTVNYTGRFLDGFVFDTNVKEVAEAIGRPQQTYTPLEFTVKTDGTNSMIKGFNYAVLLMKKGAKAKVIIPSLNAYGKFGVANPGQTAILPYTTLIFEIELLTIKKGKQ